MSRPLLLPFGPVHLQIRLFRIPQMCLSANASCFLSVSVALPHLATDRDSTDIPLKREIPQIITAEYPFNMAAHARALMLIFGD